MCKKCGNDIFCYCGQRSQTAAEGSESELSDLLVELPAYLEICPICNGAGEYEQTYNAGCGMGSYKLTGPCDCCRNPNKFMKGLGYRMKGGEEVPKSVINQIERLRALL